MLTFTMQHREQEQVQSNAAFAYLWLVQKHRNHRKKKPSSQDIETLIFSCRNCAGKPKSMGKPSWLRLMKRPPPAKAEAAQPPPVLPRIRLDVKVWETQTGAIFRCRQLATAFMWAPVTPAVVSPWQTGDGAHGWGQSTGQDTEPSHAGALCLLQE